MQETGDAERDGSPKSQNTPSTVMDRNQTASNTSLSGDIMARTVAQTPQNERMPRGVHEKTTRPGRRRVSLQRYGRNLHWKTRR